MRIETFFLALLFFTSAVSAIQYPHFRDNVNISTVYIKTNITAGQNYTFYIYDNYYTNAGNGKRVWSHFDDFEDGSINTSLWTTYAGAGVESGGVLDLGGTTKMYIDTDYTNMTLYAQAYFVEFRFLGVNDRLASGDVDFSNDVYMIHNDSGTYGVQNRNGGTTSQSFPFPSGVYAPVLMKLNSSERTVTYYNGNLIANLTGNVPSSADMDLYLYTYAPDTEILRLQWIGSSDYYLAREPAVNCVSNVCTINAYETKNNIVIPLTTTYAAGNISVFDIDLGFGSVEYETKVVEGSSSPFNFTYEQTNISNIYANLTYNNSIYPASLIDVSGNAYTFQYNLSIPSISINNTNVSFYWNYTVVYTNSTISQKLTSQYNQSITSIGLTNCSDGDKIYSLIFKNEDTQNSINATLTVEGTIKNGNVEKNYSFSYSLNSTQYVCSLQNSGEEQINATLIYTSPGYDIRQYFINSLKDLSILDNVSLYLANTSSTDVWTITVIRDTSGVEGATVEVIRKYGGNSTLVANKLTDSSGITQFNLYTGTVQYRFNVYDEYGDLKVSTTYAFLPSGQGNSLTFTIGQGQLFDFYKLAGYSSTCTESINQISCDVYDASGTPSTFTLIVYFTNGFNGTTTACTQPVLTASGTVTCSNLNTTSVGSLGCFSYVLSARYAGAEYVLETNANELCRLRPQFGYMGGILVLLVFVTLVFLALEQKDVELQTSTITVAVALALFFAAITNLFVIPFSWMIVAAFILAAMVVTK